MPSKIAFVSFQEKHLPIFRDWLCKPHVKPFWQEPESEQELKEKFFSKLPGRGVASFIIEHQGVPVGYIQYYDAAKIGGGWWENEPPGTYGIDVMIGEESLAGKGNGPKIIESFISFLRQQESDVISVIIDPDPNNARAIRAFEKAGFTRESKIKTPNGMAVLMRRTLAKNLD